MSLWLPGSLVQCHIMSLWLPGYLVQCHIMSLWLPGSLVQCHIMSLWLPGYLVQCHIMSLWLPGSLVQCHIMSLWLPGSLVQCHDLSLCCSNYRSKFSSEETVLFCLRVMVGAIILYDHVHPVGAFAKSSGINVSRRRGKFGVQFWYNLSLTTYLIQYTVLLVIY